MTKTTLLLSEGDLHFNAGRVAALQELRNDIDELEQAMQELGDPLLADIGHLQLVYDAYLNVFRRKGQEGEAHIVRNRKKFLLVALYLFSPSALAGCRMRMGLRKRISEIFGLATSSPISDNCVGLIVQYNMYADFRSDVEEILQEVYTLLCKKCITC